MKIFNNTHQKRLSGGFVLSTLACCISAVMSGSAWAEEVTELSGVSASRDAAPAVQAKVAETNKSRLVKAELDPEKKLPLAARTAPSHGDITASAAKSVVNQSYIDNQLPPTADYTAVVDNTPGTFSMSPNGPGLGQAKTYFRGFNDGDYTMTFDGIPFQDTNGNSHHSWVFFPAQVLGGAVVDRSPGKASTVGPANFGGSINLLSKKLTADPSGSITLSDGSFSNRQVGVVLDTGNFGPEGSSNLMVSGMDHRAAGYQEHADQRNDDVAVKYQFAFTPDTVLTLFGTHESVMANVLDAGVRRQDLAKDKRFFLNLDPNSPYYIGYNNYHVKTDFEYAGLTSDLGAGWKLDNKLYGYDYVNMQYLMKDPTKALQGSQKAPFQNYTAVDKLNSYFTVGDILRLSQESDYGIFRTGVWFDRPRTNRHQIYNNPLTGQDAVYKYTANAKQTSGYKFSQSFTTTTVQPFMEYEFHPVDKLQITPGVKYAHYEMDFTQNPSDTTGTPNIIHSKATYHDWQPSIDVHYLLQPNWSVYGQFAYGDLIPQSSVYDVKANAAGMQLVTNPKVTTSRTSQIGTVYQDDRISVDADAFHIKFDNAYNQSTDSTGTTIYTAAGSSTANGAEVDGNYVLGYGFSVNGNATYVSNKYDSNSQFHGQYASLSPTNTEGLGLNWANDSWNLGVQAKRIGDMWEANSVRSEGYRIKPWNTVNLAANYTLHWAQPNLSTRFQFTVNNLIGKQYYVDVKPAGTPDPVTGISAPNAADNISQMAPRSFQFAITQNF